MSNAENSVSEPSNLKIFWGRIPPDPPTRGRGCLWHSRECPSFTRKPSYGPVFPTILEPGTGYNLGKLLECCGK